jgi:hypothetical protein
MPCGCPERAQEALDAVDSGEAGPVLTAALRVPPIRRHFERTAAGVPILSRRQREEAARGDHS